MQMTRQTAAAGLLVAAAWAAGAKATVAAIAASVVVYVQRWVVPPGVPASVTAWQLAAIFALLAVLLRQGGRSWPRIGPKWCRTVLLVTMPLVLIAALDAGWASVMTSLLPAWPTVGWGDDRGGHFWLAWAITLLLTGARLFPTKPDEPPWQPMAVVVLVMLVGGAVIELLQWPVGRSSDGVDYLAHVLGVLAAVGHIAAVETVRELLRYRRLARQWGRHDPAGK